MREPQPPPEVPGVTPRAWKQMSVAQQSSLHALGRAQRLRREETVAVRRGKGAIHRRRARANALAAGERRVRPEEA